MEQRLRTTVRVIMHHDAERCEIANGRESWSFITYYGSELMTTITFNENSKVVETRQTPWNEED